MLGGVWLCLLSVLLKSEMSKASYVFVLFCLLRYDAVQYLNTTCGEINPVNWDPFSSQCLIWDCLSWFWDVKA